MFLYCILGHAQLWMPGYCFFVGQQQTLPLSVVLLLVIEKSRSSSSSPCQKCKCASFPVIDRNISSRVWDLCSCLSWLKKHICVRLVCEGVTNNIWSHIAKKLRQNPVWYSDGQEVLFDNRHIYCEHTNNLCVHNMGAYWLWKKERACCQ